MHLYKDKIKFDDWKCFKNYLLANKGYLFKFDLKNGYHHIDIFDSHQTYLGFSWDIKEATKYSVFSLTLWLILCTILLTKVVRPLVKHWHLYAVKIACLGIAYTYQDALSCSNFVKATLINLAFVPNVKKSVWIPCQRVIWLGIAVNINNNTLSITSSRITSILNKIEFLTNKIYISARE